MELGRRAMAIFIILYSNMAILKNGAKTNVIIMLLMHAYPLATSDLGLQRSLLMGPFSVV